MKYNSRGNAKVKLIAHSDLDGTAAAIIARIAFNDNVDIELIVLSQLPEAIYEVLRSREFTSKKYDFLFIVDLSIDIQLADFIEQRCKERDVIVKLFDHHKTSQNLISKPWCMIKDGTDICGSSLFFNFLMENLYDSTRLSLYEKFIKYVAKYDTGNWSSTRDYEANQLNSLLYVFGKRRFIERFIEDPEVAFSDAEKALLLLEEERKTRYVFSKTFNLYKGRLNIPTLGRFDIGLVCANDCYNEITQYIFNKHLDVSLLLIINLPYSISYRVRPGVDVDASKIAEYFGGGGHLGASGNAIPDSLQISLISNLFNLMNAQVELIKCS